MTDLGATAEHISHAMDAADQAHSASQTLRHTGKRETLAVFRERIKAPEDDLQQLKTAFDSEEAFAMDALIDALSYVHSGHVADRRETPRMCGSQAT